MADGIDRKTHTLHSKTIRTLYRIEALRAAAEGTRDHPEYNLATGKSREKRTIEIAEDYFAWLLEQT